MDTDVERFLSKLESIMDLSERHKTSMNALYQSLSELEGGEEAINAIYNVISLHDLKQKLMDQESLPYLGPGILIIDQDEILYIKGKSVESCESKDANYIKRHFGVLLDILDSDEIREVFLYKNEKCKGKIYQVNLIEKSTERTIECLKKCIQLVNGNSRVTYIECMDCSNWLIEMLPTSKMNVKWGECRYVICEAFRKIYHSRNNENFYELLGKCSALICDTEYWCFLNDLETNYSQEQYDVFWNQLKRRMKSVFLEQCYDFLKYENEYFPNTKKFSLFPYLDERRE